ncbi:MAG: hypothetical protein LBR93_09015 [Treponema sp.]|jgi:hypothetical protein|nr:hypothetical protein [Treponema sp.]
MARDDDLAFLFSNNKLVGVITFFNRDNILPDIKKNTVMGQLIVFHGLMESLKKESFGLIHNVLLFGNKVKVPIIVHIKLLPILKQIGFGMFAVDVWRILEKKNNKKDRVLTDL